MRSFKGGLALPKLHATEVDVGKITRFNASKPLSKSRTRL
jgi:hypothetical protein